MQSRQPNDSNMVRWRQLALVNKVSSQPADIHELVLRMEQSAAEMVAAEQDGYQLGPPALGSDTPLSLIFSSPPGTAALVAPLLSSDALHKWGEECSHLMDKFSTMGLDRPAAQARLPL